MVSLESRTFSTRDAFSQVIEESHLNIKRDLWMIMSMLNQYFMCEE